ncbi:hypothetical protein GCM10022243_45810 [Saccharothrix violaceirubra]|uniref:Uncharacterized protein n=1 Tax=Saccharothrix violaceirubra TaxID=413306 RepID=A0A7W7T0W6_9PSEU|nr:hypothetical protein [Saccharothrix violaceirubra]MBB4964529.1 hypothetical protein [Saccharothrix violaceirubra]
MSGIMSRWAVQRDHAVEGAVTAEQVERWIDDACTTYLDLCPLLTTYDVRRAVLAIPDPGLFGTPNEMTVTASATEVRPGAFTLSVRLRPFGGGNDTPANVTCVVTLTDPETGAQRPVGDDIRDQLIAIEHGARHFN